MLEKIRNWIIKKLGGYTKTEYQYINRIEVPKLRVEPHEVVTLCEQTQIHYMHKGYLDYELLAERYRNMLRDRLMYQLGAYIEYEAREAECGELVMRATLRVLQRK